MASLTSSVHHRVWGLPPRQAPETLRPQLRAATSTMEVENMVHSNSISTDSRSDPVEAPPEVGVEDLFDRGLGQTFPTDPHSMFGSAESVQLPLQPSDPTHHQMVIS